MSAPQEPFVHTQRIAYFSMEMALRNDIPTYAGGLGVLAGDTLRSSADLEIPLVGVTLVSRRGYFRQQLDGDGNQTELEQPWEPERWAQRLGARVAVPIENREVWVQAWLYVLAGSTGYNIPVVLLDTDLDDNAPQDREITHYLYGRDSRYRLKQEIVLGIGGTRLLRALGFSIRLYHMNEGHSALLALELLRMNERSAREAQLTDSRYDEGRVREQCLFTTHTPVEAGHDKFSYDLVTEVLDEFVDLNTVRKLAGHDKLNMTQLALRLSGYVNGVAERHARTSNRMFPGYRVHAVTNGIHPTTWAHPAIASLLDQQIPQWRHEPELLVRADRISDRQLWEAHLAAKRTLVDCVQRECGVALDMKEPVIGFARRMTSYKRPELLFKDIERLRQIAQRHPFQLVIAGKAHPADNLGKELIRIVHSKLKSLGGEVKWAYLPDYRMSTALSLVAGSDIWLNTPLPPMEASGTSGMKAAMNGVLNLSVLDGWWVEGYVEGVTGWAIGSMETSHNGEHANNLYDLLEHQVLPLYYGNKTQWLAMMKGAISKTAYYFNSHRMMRRYATEAYLF